MITKDELKSGKLFWYADETRLRKLIFMDKVHNRKVYNFEEKGKRIKLRKPQFRFLYSTYNEAALYMEDLLKKYSVEYGKAARSETYGIFSNGLHSISLDDVNFLGEIQRAEYIIHNERLDGDEIILDEVV